MAASSTPAGGGRLRVAQVVEHRGVQEERVLGDDGHLFAQRFQLHVADVDPIHRTAPPVGSYSRMISDASDVLPAPDGPTSPIVGRRDPSG